MNKTYKKEKSKTFTYEEALKFIDNLGKKVNPENKKQIKSKKGH